MLATRIELLIYNLKLNAKWKKNKKKTTAKKTYNAISK